jgi:hypothetical protein
VQRFFFFPKENAGGQDAFVCNAGKYKRSSSISKSKNKKGARVQGAKYKKLLKLGMDVLLKISYLHLICTGFKYICLYTLSVRNVLLYNKLVGD